MIRTAVRRRTMLSGAAAAAGVALSGLGRGDDKSRYSHSDHSTGFGAYRGTVDGVRTPFDGTINNNTLAVTADERTAVVSNSGSDRLIVIDLRDGRRRHEITGYATPRSILIGHDNRSFTVSDSTLGVVDTISLRDYRLLSRIPLGAGVFGTAVTKDGKTLYANNQAAGTVTVVDLVQNRPVTVIPGFAQPRQGVMLAPAQDVLYVTNFMGDRITKVDTATFARIGEITGFNKVRGLSISRDGRRLYAANSGENTISIVDTNSGTTLQKVPVGQDPYGAALAPNEQILLSGNLMGNSLTAIRPATGEVVGTVTDVIGPRQAISYSKDSSIAWVLNADLTVAEVDVKALRVKRLLGLS